MDVQIRESNLSEAIAVHLEVKEFLENTTADAAVTFLETEYTNRCQNVDVMLSPLILVASINSNRAGYLIAYERVKNPSNPEFYVWMAGVTPSYRRYGILKRMIDYVSNRAFDAGYKKLTIRTRNRWRQMLSFLIRDGWNLTQVSKTSAKGETLVDVSEFRVDAEKTLSTC